MKTGWLAITTCALVGCGSSSPQPGVPDAPGQADAPAFDAPDVPIIDVDAQRVSADLMTITGVRAPGSQHWQEVQDLCAARFEELGYTVERHQYTTGVNVIGVRTGTTTPAERVYISAHYDSTNGCPGADDNGSGVAGVLEAARVLSLDPHARTLVVACWDQEEGGLIGSSAYVSRATTAGEQIVASFVFEMIGYRSTEPNSQQTDPSLELVFPAQTAAIEANQNRGDFILLIHDDAAASAAANFEAAAASIGLPTITLPVSDGLKASPFASGLRRSDHAPFWDAGFPAIQITDTANYRNPHYHCGSGSDAFADIDLAFAALNIQATVAAAAAALD